MPVSFGQTASKFLQVLEINTESDIARELKVSRQRIHQLKQRFGVCKLVPKRKIVHKCANCGTILVPQKRKVGIYYRKYCPECKFALYHVLLKCEKCGKEFDRYKRRYLQSIRKGYKHIFCSNKCKYESWK